MSQPPPPQKGIHPNPAWVHQVGAKGLRLLERKQDGEQLANRLACRDLHGFFRVEVLWPKGTRKRQALAEYLLLGVVTR